MPYIITATVNTWLKKSTNMAVLLEKGEKHFVKEGESYTVRQKIQNKHKHTQYEFEYGLGVWFTYDKHWKVNNQDNDVESIYQEAMAFMLQWEGGYVNHPNDRGGATNRGIIQRNYDAYRLSKGLKTRSVRYITDDEVKDIYWTRYWEASKANIIAKRSKNLAIAHFDWAVNAGVGRAITTLQECINTTPDGVWGANTDLAWQSAAPQKVLNCYLERRGQLYRLWGRGSQSVFLRGWLNRLDSLKDLIG